MIKITNKSINVAIDSLNQALNLPTVAGTYVYSHNECGYRLELIVNESGGICPVLDYWFKTSEFYYILLAFRAGKLSE